MFTKEEPSDCTPAADEYVGKGEGDGGGECESERGNEREKERVD